MIGGYGILWILVLDIVGFVDYRDKLDVGWRLWRFKDGCGFVILFYYCLTLYEFFFLRSFLRVKNFDFFILNLFW